MKHRVVTIVLVGAGLTLFVVPARTAPKPAEIPESWELEFEYEKIKPLRIRLPGRSEPELFWYMCYTVTNRTGEDQVFVPQCVMYADTGQVLRAGKGVPPVVFKTVKKLLNNPLLKDNSSMGGKLLQGEDNAKDGVAIWADFDPKAGVVDVFFGGVSGEKIEVRLPKPVSITETDVTGKTQTVMKDKVVLAKTLMLRYSIPGEAAARLTAPVKLLSTSWVMR